MTACMYNDRLGSNVCLTIQQDIGWCLTNSDLDDEYLKACKHTYFGSTWVGRIDNWFVGWQAKGDAIVGAVISIWLFTKLACSLYIVCIQVCSM